MTIEECKDQINKYYEEINVLYNKINVLENEEVLTHLEEFSEDILHRYYYTTINDANMNYTSVMHINKIEEKDGVNIFSCTHYDYFKYADFNEYTFVQKQIKLPLRDLVRNFKADKYLTPSQFLIYKTQCELNVITQTDIPTIDEIINELNIGGING